MTRIKKPIIKFKKDVLNSKVNFIVKYIFLLKARGKNYKAVFIILHFGLSFSMMADLNINYIQNLEFKVNY